MTTYYIITNHRPMHPSLFGLRDPAAPTKAEVLADFSQASELKIFDSFEKAEAYSKLFAPLWAGDAHLKTAYVLHAIYTVELDTALTATQLVATTAYDVLTNFTNTHGEWRYPINGRDAWLEYRKQQVVEYVLQPDQKDAFKLVSASLLGKYQTFAPIQLSPQEENQTGCTLM